MLTPTGRTVMVSGANRGLGNAIAKHLHSCGYNVSAGGRNVDQLEAALAECAGDRLLCHAYDASSPGDERTWVDATVERFGSLDIVVNNAGILNEAKFDELTDDIVNQMMQVNLNAPLRMTQAAMPHLRACGSGRVVNVSSLSGLRVAGEFAPGYAMSKHAAIALSEATKQAGWSDGVRVTSVCPGYIATDMTSSFGEDPTTMIDPDDLAELIATTIALPNTASVAQLTVACRLEPHF